MLKKELQVPPFEIGGVSSLPFKGRVRVGMGKFECLWSVVLSDNPIPLPTSPLKGEGFLQTPE